MSHVPHRVTIRFGEGKIVEVGYADLSKAIDSADHRMPTKMIHYRVIKGSLSNWVPHFVMNRPFYDGVGDISSEQAR